MAYIVNRYRLYPTKEQEQAFNQTLGCCRFVWNKFLEASTNHYNKTGKFLFGIQCNKILPELKKEFPWLKEPNAQSLQQIGLNLDKAFRNRFKSGFGFPKFKSKKNERQSFSIPQHFKINKKRINLPKIGEIKYIQHRPIQGTVKSLNISKDVDQWYVNVLQEINDPELQNIDPLSIVGLDVGISTFVTTSDGEIFELPKTLKKTRNQIKHLQRKHSRKKKASKNREKARIKLARKHRRLRFQQNDYLNKVVNSITKNYDIIAMENLNIKGMLKNRKLSKSIQEQSWYSFKQKMALKCQLLGKHLIEIDRFSPSSKTCSNCGHRKEKLLLSERSYNCSNCGSKLDRDLNAAINIKNTAGMAGIQACGEPAIWGVDSLTSRYDLLKQEAVDALASR